MTKKSAIKAKSTQTKKKQISKVKKGNPIDIILAKMAEMDQIGVTEVTEVILLQATGYARNDSTGYRSAIKELIKERGHIDKTSKDKKITYQLTTNGRKYLVDSGQIVVAPEPTNNDELHEHLKGMLSKMVKAPPQKLEAVFNKLKDGNWYSIKELLEVAGYAKADSTGYRRIISGMKTLDILEKSKDTLRFNDNFFKFGRCV
ncbi:hypothetical protein FRACYDRAFT_248575 [Fragilariopsis cylindrus CCMP1102]|uniref:Uncharacterized protein n=1 Tax=Fragilariopsis cylindrus CCMP1102 TaxID=635003 RepID=A0A1E7ET89_9STRA|nr:hypothetical protein FRACYDRAFT_248575 [Fragilariopsis cylindrus CCMP1102]|eukprot:OEU09240.1 hypothetical protein FRACYDRAFT_248575 [Fragilariopsis cylindrus CCMP1102]